MQRHPVNQSMGSLVNLSQTRVLNKMELSVLQKGLSFIPRDVGGTSWNRLEAEEGLTAYHRRLKLADFFEGEEGQGQRAPFTGASEWEPRNSQVGELVWRIMEEDRKMMKGIKGVPEESNLSRGEWGALRGLRVDHSLIIKPADKGSVVVTMDREQYVREAMRQLGDREFYEELQEPIFLESVELIQEELGQLQERGSLSAKQVQYIKGSDTPRERRFYLLPKIHKDRATWPFPDIPPGRPIVSDCSSESYGVAEYIMVHLNPLSIKHASYIRDTSDFLGKVQGIRIGPDSSLFTMDVESLYTNIEIERGLEAVAKCLRKYPSEGRPDQCILRLLELSLRRNDFGFNGRHFLQIKGTAMGEKVCPRLRQYLHGGLGGISIPEV